MSTTPEAFISSGDYYQPGDIYLAHISTELADGSPFGVLRRFIVWESHGDGPEFKLLVEWTGTADDEYGDTKPAGYRPLEIVLDALGRFQYGSTSGEVRRRVGVYTPNDPGANSVDIMAVHARARIDIAKAHLDKPRWSAAECAEYVGVTRSTWRAYVAEHGAPAPCSKVGRENRWDAEQVRAWHAGRPGSGRWGDRG